MAERLVFSECKAYAEAINALISTYFTFNIEYPKQLYSLFIFLQHFVLKLRDEQGIPSIVTRVLSSLDTLRSTSI